MGATLEKERSIVRVSSSELAKAMARQLRACLSDLPEAPSAVRAEMLSMASTLRYLSAELEHSREYTETCNSAAMLLRDRIQSIGLNLPTDVPSILAAISSPTFPVDTGTQILDWAIEFLHSCNQAELGMYRHGLRARGGSV